MSEPPEDYAPVIELRPGQDADDDARPLATSPRPDTWCQHRRTELNGESRRVFCRDCGREVPAFDVLQDLCRDWERYIEGRREAKRRCDVAEGNLEAMLRDERNAKARRRNWRRQEPEAMRHLRELAGLCRQLAGRGHPAALAALEFLDRDVD